MLLSLTFSVYPVVLLTSLGKQCAPQALCCLRAMVMVTALSWLPYIVLCYVEASSVARNSPQLMQPKAGITQQSWMS